MNWSTSIQSTIQIIMNQSKIKFFLLKKQLLKDV